jgi:uncharacterized phiE125 gp8 family phage protein
MGLTLITPPASLPVTLADAKAQCRVESDDEDSLIEGLIAAATDYVEQYTGRALITQTWRLTLDEFTHALLLPKGPVQTVTHVRYFDSEGAEQTVLVDDYTLDNTSDPAWVVINSGASWPVTQSGVNMVKITFVAGYTEVPSSITHAILLLIGQWFDNRSAVSDKAVIAVPNAVESLLTNYRNVLV